MSESLPAFRRRWKSEIDFRLFCYKEHSQTGKSVPDMQWEKWGAIFGELRRRGRSGYAMEQVLPSFGFQPRHGALRICNGRGRPGWGTLEVERAVWEREKTAWGRQQARAFGMGEMLRAGAGRLE